MPPSVACAEVDTSTGNQTPCGLRNAFSASSAIPGCTVTVARDGSAFAACASNATTPFSHFVWSPTSAAPTVWPHCEVPPPRGSTGTFRSRATSSAIARSASLRGTATPIGSTW